MAWKIDYEPRTDQVEQIAREVVRVESLDDVPATKSKFRLYLLPRLDKSRYMRRNLTLPTREFHRQLLENFGEKLVSFKTVRTRFPQLDQRSVSQRIHILWVNGYADKYVMGQYRRGLVAARKKTGIVGRFWGVHYSFYRERQI